MNIVSGQPTRILVNGTTLNAQVDGREGAPWLVFCNSLASSLSMWDRQAEAFGARFRILRYDQRGHGASDVPPNDATTFEDLSADIAGLLDAFGIAEAVLAGASMGATTVVRAAARYPERCRAVVACDGQWSSPAGSGAMWDERVAAVKSGGMASLAEATARRWFLPDFYAANPDLMKRVEAMVAATPPGGYIACAAALRDYDYRADHPSLSLPVLYLVGAQDGDLPKVMREMADATPGSRYQIVDKCGHLPNIEQPETFFRAVDEFVRDLGIA